MAIKFTIIPLAGREYTATEIEGHVFVAAHFHRHMKYGRITRATRKIDPRGKLGRKLVEIATARWAEEKAK